MAEVNHFAISAILGSEIAGRVNFGHGQIASLSGAQKYLDATRGSRDTVHQDLKSRLRADVHAVVKAFLAVRDTDGDQRSPDLYVADSERNAKFIAKCRELGLQESEYALNKTLFYARKNGYLSGLHSITTSFKYDDYAFASEFAATEIRYETGASIDDILCHPVLAARFDAIARRLAPGFASLRYRWAILSIRKAGRQAKWESGYVMPEMTTGFKLLGDTIDRLPTGNGVYLLLEKEKPLYARATIDLRHGVELHRKPAAMSAIANPFWRPNLEDFTVSYATVEEQKLLRPIERRVVEDWKPIFNILRSLA